MVLYICLVLILQHQQYINTKAPGISEFWDPGKKPAIAAVYG